MIGHNEVLRTREVVRRSGAAEQMEDLLRPVAAGRPRGLSAETWLVGLMLTAAHAKSMTMTQVHRVLTRDISLPDQVLLGVRSRTTSGRHSEPITLRQVRYIGCAIEARLAHTEARVGPDLPEEARTARAGALQQLADRLLAASMPTHITHQGHYAVDETGVWSWAIGHRHTDAEADTDEPKTKTKNTRKTKANTNAKKVADPDAAWGYKTAKVGEKEMYFGYSVFGFARIPALGATTAQAPVLTERIVVRPATNDITEPVLEAIDRLRAEGRTVAEIAADRAWSYRTADKWADELRARQIEHTFDLHPNDNQVADHEGMPVIARVAHCPALPQELKDIKRPVHLGKGEERDKFLARIEQRATYAMAPLTRPDANGNMRVQCPALTGKVICPLRALHPLAEDNDAPHIAAPPQAAGRPKCCIQQSVTIPASVQPKLSQRFTWGSREWIAAYSRRTHIEGAFGNMKNRNTENLARGWTQAVGLVKTTIMLAALAAASNLRLLRKWAARVGDHTDPVTVPDQAEAFVLVDPHTGQALDPDPPGDNG